MHRGHPCTGGTHAQGKTNLIGGKSNFAHFSTNQKIILFDLGHIFLDGNILIIFNEKVRMGITTGCFNISKIFLYFIYLEYPLCPGDML